MQLTDKAKAGQVAKVLAPPALVKGLPDVSDIPGLADEWEEIAAKIEKAHRIKAEMEGMERELGELKRDLAAAQYGLGMETKGLRYRDMIVRASMIEGRASISKELLLENGVRASVITASMKKGNDYLQVKLEKA